MRVNFMHNIIIYNFIYTGSFVYGQKEVKYLNKIKLLNNELVLEMNKVEDLQLIILFLQKHYKYQFKELVTICAIDYIKPNNRFCLNYLFLSFLPHH